MQNRIIDHQGTALNGLDRCTGLEKKPVMCFSKNKGLEERGFKLSECMWIHYNYLPEWALSRQPLYRVTGLIQASLKTVVGLEYRVLGIEIMGEQLITYSHPSLNPLIREAMEDSSTLKEVNVGSLLKVLFEEMLVDYHDRLALFDSQIEKIVQDIMVGERYSRKLYRIYNAASKNHRGVHDLIYVLSRLSRVYEELSRLRDEAVSLENMYSTTIDRIMQAFSLYYTVIGEKTNRVVTKLTVISAIFLPLTLIAGIYGMNFKYMPELDNPISYPLTLLIMILIAVTELIYFKRRKWL